MADMKKAADHVNDMQNHMSLMSKTISALRTAIGSGGLGSGEFLKAGDDAWAKYHSGLSGNAASDLHS